MDAKLKSNIVKLREKNKDILYSTSNFICKKKINWTLSELKRSCWEDAKIILDGKYLKLYTQRKSGPILYEELSKLISNKIKD